jgi:hypothetical protein
MNAITFVAAEPAIAAADATAAPASRFNWFRVQVYAAGLLGCLTFWCGVIWTVSQVWP